MGAFDLPRDRVFEIAEADFRVEASAHPFERDNLGAAAAHWRTEHAANPALFDGRIMLFSSLRFDGRVLRGACHEVAYSTFLYWRGVPEAAGAEHCFGHAIPVSSDGRLIAIKMGPRTAGAGKVYFAAGSFEPVDVVNGRLDIVGNMAREVGEETGLDLAAARQEARWHAWSRDGRTVIFKRFVLALTAEEIVAAIDAHVAAESDPEIVGAVVIRDAEDLPAALAPQMPPLIAWHFANPEFAL